MHFAKCTKKQSLLGGCSHEPHGHLWRDEDEEHSLIHQPPLTTKKVAKEAVMRALGVFGYNPIKHHPLFVQLEEEIDAADLPD